MGQQQLLLFILITIVVGIATLVAVEGADVTRVEAGKDAIRSDLVRAIADAQTYYYKPESMGGGGLSFHNISFDDLTLEETSPDGKYYALKSDQHRLILVGVNPEIDIRVEAKVKIDPKGNVSISWND